MGPNSENHLNRGNDDEPVLPIRQTYMINYYHSFWAFGVWTQSTKVTYSPKPSLSCWILVVVDGGIVKERAGLRVVPEWSYERQWEAHFRRSVLRLWYICGLAWSKTTFGKISQKSEPSADFTRFGHFHFFNLFHFFGEPGIYNLCKP